MNTIWVSLHDFGTFINGEYTVQHVAEYEFVVNPWGLPDYKQSTGNSRIVPK